MRQRCHKKLLVQKERTYDVNSTATAQSPLSARPTTAAQSSPVRLLRDQRSRRAWWRREVTMSLGTRTQLADATRGTRRIYCKANLLSKPHQQPVYFRPGTTKRRKKARKMKGNGTARNVENIRVWTFSARAFSYVPYQKNCSRCRRWHLHRRREQAVVVHKNCLRPKRCRGAFQRSLESRFRGFVLESERQHIILRNNPHHTRPKLARGPREERRGEEARWKRGERMMQPNTRSLTSAHPTAL